MSAHRAPRSASPTWHRSRAAIGGAAMTTLFLTGGAGVAFAGDNGDEGEKGGNKLSVLSGNSVGNNNLNGNEVAADVLDGVELPDLPDLPDVDLPDVNLGGGDKTGSDNDVKGDHNNVGNVNSFNNTTTNHNHTHEGRDCSCPKDQKKHDDDCDKVESDTAKDDTKDVESDDTDDTNDVASDSDDSDVDSDATIVPVGSADTGDGSVLGPLPAPAIAPVASSWSMADTMFTGGGIAAAALIASAGVSMGRHRREGAHRV